MSRPPNPDESGQFARGADDLVSVLAQARERGDGVDVTAVGAPDRPELRCGSCRQTYRAERAQRTWTRRLEGASDPADEMIVHALRCPRCGAVGVLTLPFGPRADALQAATLRALADSSEP